MVGWLQSSVLGSQSAIPPSMILPPPLSPLEMTVPAADGLLLKGILDGAANVLA